MIFAFFYCGKVGKGGNRAKKQGRFRFGLGLGLSLIRVKVSLNPNRSFLRFRLLERFPPFSTFPPFSHILLQLKSSAAKIVLFFFATCDAVHLTCFDELSIKKKSPRFAPVQNGLYIL